MGKIKVLMINKLYPPVTGGIEVVTQSIAEALNSLCDVRVLVCNKGLRTLNETVNGVSVRRSGSLGVFFSVPVSLKFFADYLRLRKEADIVHIHMPFPLADAAVAIFGFKGKVILSWHSDIIRQKALLFFLKPFMNKLIKRADRIIVATKGHIDGSDHIKQYTSKCSEIPFCVPDELLNKADAYFNRQREDAADRKRAFVVLFVGRLVYYKGCGVLIKAFSMLRGNARLIIIGDGPLKTELINMARELGVLPRIEFITDADDEERDNYFMICDVFVLPSIAKSEAFGLVQIEAMAFGKPVINTALASGVPHVSVNGETGITVPANDPEALAAAIGELMRNDELRKKYGDRARAIVREKYTVEKMKERIFLEYSLLTNKL